MECYFCQRTDKDPDIIYKTKYWRVAISELQTYIGCCRIELKRHCEDLAEVKPSEWREFFKIIKTNERALRKSFGATMFNWACLMNIAYQKVPPHPHIHWLMVPRYARKVNFAGTVFEDLEFGDHYTITRRPKISNRARQKILEKIKSNL